MASGDPSPFVDDSRCSDESADDAHKYALCHALIMSGPAVCCQYTPSLCTNRPGPQCPVTLRSSLQSTIRLSCLPAPSVPPV